MAHEIATINDKNVAITKDNVNLFDGSVENILVFMKSYSLECMLSVRVARSMTK